MELTVIGVAVFFVVTVLVEQAISATTVSTTPKEVPLMKEYRDCAKVINNQLPWNNCYNSIDASLACTRKLARSVNACPDDHKVDDDYICNLMVTELEVSPMASSSKEGLGLSICKIISELSMCRQNECTELIRQPKSRDTGMPCSEKAWADCVVGYTFNDGRDDEPQYYTRSNCIIFQQRKNCIVTKLQKCSGTFTQQMAADLTLIGLDNHLEKCTKAEKLCDNVTIPYDILKRARKSSELTKDDCNEIHKTYEDLEKCITGHKKITADTVRVQANGTLEEVEIGKNMCIKKGYLAVTSPGGASNLRLQPTMAAFFVITLILTALVH